MKGGVGSSRLEQIRQEIPTVTVSPDTHLQIQPNLSFISLPDRQVVVHSDSSLCIQTLTEWAPGWEKKGWRKADGKKVENEDLVRQAYGLYRSRPNVKLVWLKGHAGGTWNEVADALAGAWARR